MSKHSDGSLLMGMLPGAMLCSGRKLGGLPAVQDVLWSRKAEQAGEMFELDKTS